VQLIADRGVPAWIAGDISAAAQNSGEVTLIGAHP
jgi:hypothetical protein